MGNRVSEALLQGGVERVADVYHASRHRGLRWMVPKSSTHGQPWVYACKSRVMPALFLSETGLTSSRRMTKTW